MKKVVIVGGGISGLATAYYLQVEAIKSGTKLDCHIIERLDKLGGNVQTENMNGFVIEAGPDSFLTLKPQALDLCKRLDLSERLVGTNPTRSKTYVFVDGRLRVLPEGLVSGVPTKFRPFLTSRLITPWGKLRMLFEVFVARRQDQTDEPLSSFIKRRFGTEALSKIAEPLMAGIYAGDANNLSVLTNFPQLAKLEQEHRSLILGMMSTRHRSNDTQSGNTRKPIFMTVKGGLHVMIEALISHLENTTFVTHASVTGLRRVAGKPRPYELELDGGTVIDADCVVLATPAYTAAEILTNSSPSAASILATIPYVSTATVSLVYDSSSLHHPLDGSGFVVAPMEKRRITACTWVSSKWPTHSSPLGLLLRSFVGRAGDEEILQNNDDEICEIVQSELESILGVSTKPLLKRVYRFDRALPQYNLGHREKLVKLDAELNSLPGIFLTGSAYRGVGLPDCIKQGELTAIKIMRFLKEEN